MVDEQIKKLISDYAHDFRDTVASDDEEERILNKVVEQIKSLVKQR